MADLSTKHRILNASIQLFNENGMAYVRLQQIADAIGISVGNLAYHYRNQEAIIEAINEDLYEESAAILSAYRIFPNLIDFDHQLGKYYDFIQSYPFYFFDLIEIKRHYPEVHAKKQIHVTKMIQQIRKRFDFNVKRGGIQAEARSDLYDGLAHTIWVLITFWGPQSLLMEHQSQTSNCRFRKMVWNQMHPYFTPQGIAEYEQLILPLLKKS